MAGKFRSFFAVLGLGTKKPEYTPFSTPEITNNSGKPLTVATPIPVVSTLLPTISNEDSMVDITPTPADSSILIDSLSGIGVSGKDVDLVKVRVLGVERAKVVAMWGYKGTKRDQPATFKRFIDLTTDHLLNIKKNSKMVTSDELRIIDSILEDRIASGEVDANILN
jgi:hypothetical protein